MTDDLKVRRQLAALPIELQCADTCPQCGLHMIADLAERIAWIANGGTATCPKCKIEKTRVP